MPRVRPTCVSAVLYEDRHIYLLGDLAAGSIDCMCVVDNRLCPRRSTQNEYLLVIMVEQTLVGISAVMLVVSIGA